MATSLSKLTRNGRGSRVHDSKECLSYVEGEKKTMQYDYYLNSHLLLKHRKNSKLFTQV